MQNFLKKIEQAYPEFVFREGKKFTFRPKNTIFYVKKSDHFDLLLLHELGHALLHHYTFDTGVSRLKMERAAWDKARFLADELGVKIDDDFIEDKLDTYRNWLYSRLICPHCGLVRLETKDGDFICPRCNTLLNPKK